MANEDNYNNRYASYTGYRAYREERQPVEPPRNSFQAELQGRREELPFGAKGGELKSPELFVRNHRKEEMVHR